VAYDETIYRGAAAHYLPGRPPYSAALVAVIAAEVGLDADTRLLDVGCGPGVLTVDLAPLVGEATGLDPDPDMLAEAARHAAARGVTTIRWVRAVAEDIATLGLGTPSVVTFGQSFHWTERGRVAEAVFDLLRPGGSIVLVAPEARDAPPGPGPGAPLLPEDAVRALVASYLGPGLRAGRGHRTDGTSETYEETLARTRFGRPRVVVAPGRADLVVDVDRAVARYLSMSWAAPHLFGDRLAAFEADLRGLLRDRAPDGRFWDWPGHTHVIVARKPG
jgi:SAM-dependent methyltransferase